MTSWQSVSLAVFFVKTTRRVASRVITRDQGLVLSSKQARDSVFKRMVISPLFIEA